MQFQASELTLNKAGKIYHLNLSPGDLAEDIILVGDPDRVKLVASFFDSIRFETQAREFCSITGSYNGRDISVVSTGIGTDNVDIVLNEIDAIFNIDLENRIEKEVKTNLNFVRIGTCGALQEDIEPGTKIISKYAIGLDGIANFYDIQFSLDELSALIEFMDVAKWGDNLNRPYVKEGSATLLKLLGTEKEHGITITANGFYGPQGRALRIPLAVPDFKENIRNYQWEGSRATNLEMETSGLYALSSALGHEAITICLVLANRYSGKFMPDYQEQMKALIQEVLDTLTEVPETLGEL